MSTSPLQPGASPVAADPPPIDDTQSRYKCVKCHEPIKVGDKIEAYTFPPDGRFVHVSCVRRLLHEVLELMRNVQADWLLLDPDCDDDDDDDNPTITNAAGVTHADPLVLRERGGA